MKETSNLFLTGVNNSHKEVNFCNTEKSPKRLLLNVLIWLLWCLLRLLQYVKKAKVVPMQIWHTQFWVFMKSFADQFFLMSSSNLVLSVVQKLRSPYFTTAMQKRNARKILKVRSPHSSTIFASMMRSLPPHCGVVLLQIPSFSYIQSTHHSRELCLKAIWFLSFNPYPTKTQFNLKSMFWSCFRNFSFVCFLLLCFSFSKQLQIFWRKTSIPKPPRGYFCCCMCNFPAVVYGLA